MTFPAVAESGEASADRASSAAPASSIARVRASMRRRSSSRGTSRPTTSVECLVSVVQSLSVGGATWSRHRRARARGRSCGGRLDAGPRRRPGRARRARRAPPPRRGGRRRASSAHGRPARVQAEPRARPAQRGSRGPCRRRRPAFAAARARRRPLRGPAGRIQRPKPRGRGPRPRRDAPVDRSGWSGSAGPGRPASSLPRRSRRESRPRSPRRRRSSPTRWGRTAPAPGEAQAATSASCVPRSVVDDAAVILTGVSSPAAAAPSKLTVVLRRVLREAAAGRCGSAPRPGPPPRLRRARGSAPPRCAGRVRSGSRSARA